MTKTLAMKKTIESINHEHEIEINQLKSKTNDSKKLLTQEVHETESEKHGLKRKIEILQQQIFDLEEENRKLIIELKTQERDRSFSSEKNKIID